MSTNLPPEYFEAERRYRAAKTPAEKITCIEELIRIVPKHKGTDKLRAGLRKRLSKQKTISQTKKGAGKRESAFSIDKEGAGQVVIVGPVNVGKSALVATLTKPLNRDYMEPELLDLIRRSDHMLLIVDLQTDPVQQLEDAVALLQEHRIVSLHLKDRHTEQRGLVFIPMTVLANKNDDENSDENFEIFCELLEDGFSVSCLKMSGLYSRFRQLPVATWNSSSRPFSNNSKLFVFTPKPPEKSPTFHNLLY